LYKNLCVHFEVIDEGVSRFLHFALIGAEAVIGQRLARIAHEVNVVFAEGCLSDEEDGDEGTEQGGGDEGAAFLKIVHNRGDAESHRYECGGIGDDEIAHGDGSVFAGRVGLLQVKEGKQQPRDKLPEDEKSIDPTVRGVMYAREGII